MHIIPYEQAKLVKWKGNSLDYDWELHALDRRRHDQFLVVNFDFAESDLDNFNYLDFADNRRDCIVWHYNNIWMAKLFPKNWKIGSYHVIDILTRWERNPDIPASVKFNNDPTLTFVPDFWDTFYELVWYLKDQEVWAFKCSAENKKSKGIKNMGELTPLLSQRIDVIFISYHESNAEENWQRVLEKAPWAQRVDGVEGIFNAHKAAAALVKTDMFYVVDGDAWLVDDFDFDFQPGIFDRDCTHVWHSKNPINGLEYGYGGVKLFSKHIITSITSWETLDMTTSISDNLVVIEKSSNITNFNTDAFSTWRSAFRECVKLCYNIKNNPEDIQSLGRLETWKILHSDKDFGEYAYLGANAGIQFFNKNNESLTKINNRAWLKLLFNAMNDVGKLREDIIDSKTFCFYPFLELSTTPSGHIKPCCNYADGMYHPDGRVISIMNGDTFDNAWNSTSITDLRRKLTIGELPPPQCTHCTRDGKTSMRVRSINEYKNNIEVLNLVQQTINNEYIADHNLKRLELKPSNLCNLKCVMCNSYDSSQISKEIKALAEEYSGVEISNGRVIRLRPDVSGILESNKIFSDIKDPDWSDNETIWENFKKLVPYLEVISFAGGEPTIIPFVIKALKYCVETGYSKNIQIYLSSNFTNLNKSFFELMPSYKKFELIASIDAFDKVQEYSRFPSNWNVVSRNYILAKKYMKYDNVKIFVNITVTILNIINLTDLLYWLEDQSKEYPYFKEWPFDINLIMFPKEQQIHLISDKNKLLAISRLEEYLIKSSILKEFPGMDSKIHLLISELKRPRDMELFEKFKQQISILEKQRRNNIRESIPELDIE